MDLMEHIFNPFPLLSMKPLPISLEFGYLIVCGRIANAPELIKLLYFLSAINCPKRNCVQRFPFSAGPGQGYLFFCPWFVANLPFSGQR